MKQGLPDIQRQNGAIVPMMAGALVALLGVAALALDVGNAFRHKALLQNALDAAALSGAKVLNPTGNVIGAEQEARKVFRENASASESAPFSEQLKNGTLSLVVEFSDTLHPFVPDTAPAQYIRVSTKDLSVGNHFAQVFGLDTFSLSGSAVAGPSPTLQQVCDAVPIMTCAKGSPPFFGYEPGKIVTLKYSAGEKSPAGPGNFQLIDSDHSTPGELDVDMAGGYDNCIGGGGKLTPSLTGNKTGPTRKGINTRLGEENNQLPKEQYPPDLVTTHPDFSYSDYVAAYNNPDTAKNPDGKAGRRILTIPVVDCSQPANGKSDFSSLGFGCFFMTEESPKTGPLSGSLRGEFITDCQAHGVPGPGPGSGVGPYVIQLYEDPDSIDS